jgi:excisionase family DNA binding protein
MGSKGPGAQCQRPPHPGRIEEPNRAVAKQPNRTVSIPEAARLLGISRSHAYDLVRRGELVGVRLGRRIVVPIAAIDDMLASGSAEAG